MEDNVENVGGQQQDQGSGSASTSVNEQTQTSGSIFNPDEYVHKTRVNELIHQRTKEASQKAAEKARAEVQEQQRQGVGMGGMAQLDESKVRQMLRDEFSSLQQEQKKKYEEEAYTKRVNDLANDYIGKLQTANPELLKRQDEIYEMFSIVPYINETSEVAGVTQHLLDNEGAYANLLLLSQNSPARVRSALKKIEASIKANNEAKNRDYPNEPLSQPNPSVTTADEGTNSIEALKRQSWLRG